MVVRVVAGERTGDLVAALAESLASLADPFSPALVVVPTSGIERYLAQELARRNGVCANVDFPSPGEFLQRVAAVPHDPWNPDRLVWRVLDTIERTRSEPWCRPLSDHLYREDPGWDRSRRRFAVGLRIATRFASYAEQRPDLLRGWRDGVGPAVPADLQWQVHLWQRLRHDIGSDPFDRPLHTASLPQRFAVFGPTRLPQQLLAVLRDLPQTAELYLPVASLPLWESSDWPPPGPRSQDETRDRAEHPLLRSLGRDVRELRMLLPQAAGAAHAPAQPRPPVGALLRTLQDQIAANTPSDLPSAPGDDSLQVHGCHGPLRQVEVLREALLGLLQQHPDLQPRDVLIMAPDLDVYAPLLTAVFSDPQPRIADLRLRVADRTPEQDNEVLAALDALLALLAGRMQRSDVVDLLHHGVIANRFGLTADDVERVEELAAAAGVRWGLDAAHRAEFGLAAAPAGTWSWCLDRMALGAVLSDDGHPVVGGVLPLPAIGSGDVTVVGRLAEFLDALAALRSFSRSRHTLRDWMSALDGAITRFTLARLDRERFTVAARGAVAAYAAAAEEFADSVTLSLTEVRHMLAGVLAGRPTRSGFRLGGMTACRMEPMRSVPYRVVCLIGLDDGMFPRGSGRDGDDLLLRTAMVGERDPSSEDRQLFLDAIMAAQEHLLITYTSRDERSNAGRQPSVPLAELIALLPGGPSFVKHHPLQPFDPRNFTAAAFSHDEAALAGARAGQGARTAPCFLPAPLRPPEPMPVRSLDSLAKFLKSPPSTFLLERLGLSASWEEEQLPQEMELDLKLLAAYNAGDRVLQQALREGDPTAAVTIEGLRGQVPPGALGRSALACLLPEVADVVDRYRALLAGRTPHTVCLDLDLGDGAQQVTVGPLIGRSYAQPTFSRLKAKHVIGSWPYLLALTAAAPHDGPWRVRLCGRGGTVDLRAPDDPTAARDALLGLFAVQEAGLCQPVPLSAGTGMAYALARSAGDEEVAALQKARGAWDSGYEADERAFTVPFGGPATSFDALLAHTPLPGEEHPEESTRFGCLARRIWDPLLALNPGAGLAGQAA